MTRYVGEGQEPRQAPVRHRQTAVVRAGLERSGFAETSEALYLTSGYVYETAAEAEAAFAGEVDRYIYSRYGNPTVSVFEERLRMLEGAEACWATASGMAAVFASLASHLVTGDRVVASRALFGSCHVILTEILPQWGISTVLVDPTDLEQWAAALSQPTQAVFCETPSNPMQDLVDLEAVCRLAHEVGARVVVDNVFATPILQRPMEFGADIVVYSGTKHIDGQGRVLGGAILSDARFAEQELMPFLRHTGPSLSPFNAWTLAKGLETLELRVTHQSHSALQIAAWLESHPEVQRVLYPHLPSHPQFDLAKRQMGAGGTVVTFRLADDTRDGAFRMLDALRLFDISNNLGDTKSLVTHPATTTHRRIGPQGRAEVGITDGTIRLSIGLEHPDDLIADLEQALSGESSR
jgi:O-succinylhomoserine sulfhydrylase